MSKTQLRLRNLFRTGVLSTAILLGSASMAFSANSLSTQTSTHIPFLPDIKLLLGEGLTPAFDLAAYNNDTEATTYIINSNFLGLASLDGSTVSQAAYDSATVGTNIFIAGKIQATDVEPFYSSETVTNKVKYSTYCIRRLPKIGLTAGTSFDFVFTRYVLDSSYNYSMPPSFGNASSISLSNASTLSAEWVDESTLRITAGAGFNEASYVEVVASPSATPPYGDYDRERIYVYPNLLASGTFASESLMNRFAFDYAGERETKAGYSFASTAADYNNETAEGVLVVTLDGTTTGVKITPNVEDLIPYEAGQWYIARVKMASDTRYNGDQALLYNYSNPAFPGYHVDIAANAWFGIPYTWTWLETPLYSNRTGMGYPQLQLKGGLLKVLDKEPGVKDVTSVYIDELQLIKAVPALVESRRGDNRTHYSAGDFDDPSDINGWGIESYTFDGTTTDLPGASISNGMLHLSFDTTSSAVQGAKLTAYSEEANAIHTYASRMKRGIGAQANIVNISGDFDSFDSIAMVVAMGVMSYQSYDIGTRGSDLFATAEFGGLTPGIHRALGLAISPYYQYQFAVKTNQSGILDLDDFDGIIDDYSEDYYGDGELYY
jgi:hypothetical protein